MNWWLIIHTPTGDVYTWEVWPEGDEPDDAVINAARVAAGYPADDAAVREDGWDIQLTLNRPHDKLMARATARHRDDLRKVDPAEVAQHADERAANARRAFTAELRARLADLDDDTLTEVLGGREAVESLRTVHKGG